MRDGYIVVATVYGIVRFDGVRFERMPTPGIETIGWAHKDTKDRIWIQSWENRLGVLRDDGFRLLPPPPGYPSGETRVRMNDWVRGVSLTDDGNIWFEGYHGLLRANADDPGTFERYTTTDGLPDDTVLAVVDLAGGERVAVGLHRLARLEADSSGPKGSSRHSDRPLMPIGARPRGHGQGNPPYVRWREAAGTTSWTIRRSRVARTPQGGEDAAAERGDTASVRA